MKLDLHYLKIFYQLCLSKNYTKAGKRLNLTQSAVSHTIKKLETSLNTSLIERTSKNFKLTFEGKLLLETCEKTFPLFQEVEEKLENKNNHKEINFTLGATVEFGNTVLIDKIVEIRKVLPYYNFELSLHHNLLDKLLQNEMDLIIDCQNHLNEELTSIYLCDEPYSIISTPNYAQKHHLNKLENFNKAVLLSFDKKLNWWERFFSAIPTHLGTKKKSVFVINHIRGLINATLHEIGITIVPRYTVKQELQKGILIELFQNVEIRKDKFRIYLKNNKAKLEKNNKLILELQKSFKEF